MTLFHTIAFGAYGIMIVIAVLITRHTGTAPAGIWRLPAVGCVVFTAWTIWALTTESIPVLIANQTANLWGGQVWMDLLLAVGICWAVLLPRMRSVGMRPWPWLALVVLSASVGLTAMMARLLWLEESSDTSSA